MNIYSYNEGRTPDLSRFDLSRDTVKQIVSLAEEYRTDPDFREQVKDTSGADIVTRLGDVTPLPIGDVKVTLVADTDAVCHFVVAVDPNTALVDETLSELAGGSSASTAGSLGSVGTVGCSCVPSSVSSFFTVGTAGTAS